MDKLRRGAKKQFILDLLLQGVELTQTNLAKYAEEAGDKRLFSTRLGAFVHNLRCEGHVIETRVENNTGSLGSHAVYRYVGG